MEVLLSQCSRLVRALFCTIYRRDKCCRMKSHSVTAYDSCGRTYLVYNNNFDRRWQIRSKAILVASAFYRTNPYGLCLYFGLLICGVSKCRILYSFIYLLLAGQVFCIIVQNCLVYALYLFNQFRISSQEGLKNLRCIFKCLLFGLKNRGLLILILPDVSPASVAGIFRGLGPWVVARSLLNCIASAPQFVDTLHHEISVPIIKEEISCYIHRCQQR